MNEEKNIQFEQLLKGSKLTAPQNLEYRIMQQIETEKALARKQEKATSNIRPLLGTILVLGAILYSVMFFFGAMAYKDGGWNNVLSTISTTYLVPIMFVSIVCTAYGIISVFDEKRFLKKKS